MLMSEEVDLNIDKRIIFRTGYLFPKPRILNRNATKKKDFLHDFEYYGIK